MNHQTLEEKITLIFKHIQVTQCVSPGESPALHNMQLSLIRARLETCVVIKFDTFPLYRVGILNETIEIKCIKKR